jgi:hypothetical protein
MKNIIRPTYPKEFSIGLILLIFIIACFLSHQIFVVPIHDLNQNQDIYIGMFLASVAVIIMVLILWEEILFPVKLKAVDGGIEFRNRKSKLRMQLMMYCCIPLILGYIYFNFEVKWFRFILWVAVCMVPPILEKIISGVNNYEDFLKLTDNSIEYKNNEKEGNILIKDIVYISFMKDDRNFVEKIKLVLKNTEEVIIDLDEMELDAFYDSIQTFVKTHYTQMLR